MALAPGDPANQVISAVYCVPAVPTNTVDVLVPGATYSHTYWDWPVDPELYNYTDMTLAAGGRAVLAIDRLGTGGSSRLPSAEVTFPAEAYALHQVIAWARGGQGYARVDVIGHSLGSGIAMLDAGTWPSDPTRLVLTGALHAGSANIEAFLTNDTYPAADDPEFAGMGYDSGYLTTIPGVRGSLFYGPGANPGVIAYDEAHKSVVTGVEFAGIGVLFGPPGAENPSDEITTPVLTAVGADDALLCQGTTGAPCSNLPALYAEEQPYYARAASLTIDVVPGGHDLALSPTAPIAFAMINTWLIAEGAP